jgi:predicted permease
MSLQPDPIDDELAEHFHLLRQERLEAGDTEEQATRYARHRLGHAPAIAEAVRDLSPYHRLESAARHTRLALRALPKHALATAILTLGIGLSVALFSLVDAVILSPLPIPNEDRVHLLWKTDPANQPHLVGELAYPELADLQRDIPEAQYVALFPAAPYGNGRTLQTGANDPVQIESCPASPDFFKVLGVHPAIGRDFTPADSAPGAPPVAILSHEVWRQHFSATPNIINQPVRINNRPHTVIGVMPPHFDFPRGVGLWVNLPAANRRGMTWLQAIVRLHPNAGKAEFQSSANRALKLQLTNHPKEYAPTQQATVTPIANFLTGTAKNQLYLALAAALLLLLSACVSAGNLFLTRALSRRQEVATRTALGATRAQLLTQFATEALAASTVATLAGTAVAAAIVQVLIQLAPSDIPRIHNATLNPTALAAAIALALTAALACAIGPLLLLREKNLETLLREGGTRTAGSRTGAQLRRLFVCLQTAATVVILTACALLFSSYRALLKTDLGLDNRDAITVNLALRGPGITPAIYRKTYLELIDRLRATPGITNAAGVLLRPLEGSIGWDARYTYEFEAGTRDPLQQRKANFEVVTPGYFETIGTKLKEGRDFTDHDTEQSEKVLIISESVAAPLKDPIGKRIKVFDEQRKVIGVVADARFRGVRQPGHDVYVPNRQIDIPTNYLIIRATTPTAETLKNVRKAVKEIAPDQAIASEATLGTLMDRNTARDRFNLALLLLFAAGAVILAAAGTHAVTRESITARANEIAIRQALGAPRLRLARELITDILNYVTIGTLTGILLATALATAAKGLLYNVSPKDPLILATVAIFVLTTATLSALLPAWSTAARSGPAETTSRGD